MIPNWKRSLLNEPRKIIEIPKGQKFTPEQLERKRAHGRKYQAAKYEDFKIYREWHRNTFPEVEILGKARMRAKNKGLEFNITKEDLLPLPTHCPVLGFELKFGTGPRLPNSGSIDRIDNTKGYVKGNIRVISWRANTLKNDASLEELEAIVKYIKENIEND